MTRKIKFVTKSGMGSSLMRGNQIADYLKHKGLDVEVINNVTDEKDCVLIFVKALETHEAIKAADNNICIYDPVDIFCTNQNMSQAASFPHFHGVIFPTELQLNYFGNLFKGTLAVIPHHYHPGVQSRCEEYAAYPYTFRLGYIGADFNHKFAHEIGDVVPIYHPYQWNDWAAFFTCHYSVREPNTSEALFKPATKVFTAAAVNANIITMRDPDALAFLGEDYPYYVDKFDANDVFRVIKKASEEFEDEEWYRGLEIMKSVRERTSLEACGDLYLQYIEEVSK